jgi:competence protein ComEC
MGQTNAIVLCLAYILGLLLTKIPFAGWTLPVLGIGCAVGMPRIWRAAPKPKIWMIAGIVGLLASLYFQVRIPQPAANDISRVIPPDGTQQVAVQLQGQVESLPRLTRSQKSQFWLQVQQVDTAQGKDGAIPVKGAIAGNLYVTAPTEQAKDLHPGQIVLLTGKLYLPKAAANPGGFDFQAYLQQEDTFAGLRADQVKLVRQSTGWGWWQIQQQIVRSQALWLAPTEAALVSSMVLGARGVDLPFEVKDQFVRVGLAHALAASGFQTSLILGVILVLTQRLSERSQFFIGTGSLLTFVGLTGLQPAVLRAALMGFGGLMALVLQRKIQPLGSLLITGVLLLLFNPLWIWNLGFQLSFLATIGLLVTVPTLSAWLDRIPSTIAPLIAVPIAAYLWTLPLQLGAFGTLSPYSIPINILTTPLISLISIGGMTSAVAALIWSPAGSAIAALLKYPTQGLLMLVHFVNQWWGSSYATGTVSVAIVLLLYGLILLAWLQPWWRKHWWLALGLGVVLTIAPLWQTQTTLVQATVLSTTQQPVIVIQERGQFTVINSGDESTANFTVLPFLQKQGANQIDWAVAIAPSTTGWDKLAERLPIKFFYTSRTTQNKQLALPVGQPAKLGTTQITLLRPEPAIVQLQIQQQTWLWLGAMSTKQQAKLLKMGGVPVAQVLLWSGKGLQPELLTAIKPEVAIAAGNTIHKDTAAALQQLGTRLYTTSKDGAVQWTPTAGFKTTVETESPSSAL